VKRLAEKLHSLGYVIVSREIVQITSGNKPVDKSVIDGLKLRVIVDNRSKRKW
jgi:hypothetical protein